MKSKILITGAAGFIGSHLVEYLLEKKISLSQLRLFLHPDDNLENLPNKKFDIFRGDIRNKFDVAKAMKDVDLVYHLAAKVDFDSDNYDDYYQHNVQGTKNLVFALLAHSHMGKKIKKFVNFSSIAVYGLPADVGDVVNYSESFSAKYSNYYGQSKWEAEQFLFQAFQKYGFPFVTIRPASVYGPREKGPTLALYKAIDQDRFVILGNGENKMHYVYVKDLIAATYLAAQSKYTPRGYIVGGEKPTTLNQVASNIARSIDKSPSFIKVPVWFILPIAHFFGFFKRFFRIPVPIFPSRVRTMTSNYFYDISRAKKELNYRPRFSFAQGSKEMGKWYLQQKVNE